jgi:transcriptional regulator with XRE-family HTH domain
MKDKIEKILMEYGMTPSKFADEIGIQRSSISHILSGRNKPSLEVIQKILDRFRNINPEWILTGKGRMLKPDLPDFTNEDPVIKFDEPKAIPEESMNNHINSTLLPEKTIEKIIVFYSDKTFEVYKGNAVD